MTDRSADAVRTLHLTERIAAPRETVFDFLIDPDRPNHVIFTWGWEGSNQVPPGSSTVTITLTSDGDDTVVMGGEIAPSDSAPV